MKFKAAVKKALLKVLVNFFRWRGYGLSKLTSHGELLSFLEKVRPIPIKDKLIRVGRSGDGGYLLGKGFTRLIASVAKTTTNNSAGIRRANLRV